MFYHATENMHRHFGGYWSIISRVTGSCYDHFMVLKKKHIQESEVVNLMRLQTEMIATLKT